MKKESNKVTNSVPSGMFCGGSSVPAGTFHGGSSVPSGTFHGGSSVPAGTFHIPNDEGESEKDGSGDGPSVKDGEKESSYTLPSGSFGAVETQRPRGEFL